MQRYSDLAFTDSVKHHQDVDGSRERYDRIAVDWPAPTALDDDEVSFINASDSFYMSSVSASGWPYVQHRGGPAGFVHVTAPDTISWLERHGNRQHVTAGNIDDTDRVSLFFMDYAQRRRLKLYGHATRDPHPSPDTLAALGGGHAVAVMTVRIEAFDWNCPKYITPRFTADQVRAVTDPLRAEIASLQATIADLTRRE